MKHSLFIFFSFIVFSLSAQQPLTIDANFHGMLPCPTCQALKATVKLDNSGQYTLICDYQNVDENTVYDQTGGYIIDAINSSILLKLGKQKFFFQLKNKQLIYVDAQLNPITNEDGMNYILTQENYAIINRKWYFTELNGQKIDVDTTRNYFQLNDSINSYKTLIACNTFSDFYAIEGENKIYMRAPQTTSNNCSDTDNQLGLQLIHCIKSVSRFEIKDNELILFDKTNMIIAKLR